MSAKPQTVILRRNAVEARTGLARATIYERVRLKTFPAPIPLGGRAVGWLESDIDQWIDDQVNAARVPKGVHA
jgi:prophage regulatory protein